MRLISASSQRRTCWPITTRAITPDSRITPSVATSASAVRTQGCASQLLDILQTKPDGTQRVVLIDFPHTQMKSIGFVTRVMREQGTGRELAAVYVPTTPNPTSGYLEIVPVELITPTDWSVDQAMSFIISGGAVSPDSIPFSVPGAKIKGSTAI